MQYEFASDVAVCCRGFCSPVVWGPSLQSAGCGGACPNAAHPGSYAGTQVSGSQAPPPHRTAEPIGRGTGQTPPPPPGLYWTATEKIRLVINGWIVVMSFMICFLDSVCIGQFAKKNHSESFRIVQNRSLVRSVAFPVAVNHKMHGSQLSQWDSAPPLFSNHLANGHRSTHNITTKFLSAEERFMFGIGMWPRPVPLHHSANSTQWTASQRAGVESGRTNDRD